MGSSPGAVLDAGIAPARPTALLLGSPGQRPPEVWLCYEEKASGNEVFHKLEDLFLLGDADLTGRREKEKQAQLLLKEAELHHFSWHSQEAARFMLRGMYRASCSDLCKRARRGAWCLSSFVGKQLPPTQAACDSPSFSKSPEPNNWMSAQFSSPALTRLSGPLLPCWLSSLLGEGKRVLEQYCT